jgi:hypothetical protein
MTPEEIKKYTGSDATYLIGHISAADKHKFYGVFTRNGMTSLQLEQKTKKLNAEQKELVNQGQILKLDFETGKLLFMKNVNQWI